MPDGNLELFDSSPQGVVPLTQVALRLHPDDDVAIAKTALQVGTQLDPGDGAPVAVRQFIISGHKVALRALNEGDPIHRYGQIIAFATQPIQPGEHVHTHNAAVRDFARDYAFGTAAKPVTYVPEYERRTFQGYLRENGRVGTRNYVAVISTVNCSAHTSRQIAHHFTRERLADYANVDGVIA
ncbi:MAG: UxaA family hydrolase, partial [Anaerolineae bacterium]|nr:UxaA family hydrolase [Anaerolineae bacterium]